MQYLQGSQAVSDLSDNAAPAKPEKTTPRWRRWAGEALLFIVIVTGVPLWQARDAPRGPAPEFAGRLVDGQPFDLAAWRAAHAGGPVLLYFWAEWCPICKTTAGSVGNIGADWPVIGIATQSGPSAQVAAGQEGDAADSMVVRPVGSESHNEIAQNSVILSAAGELPNWPGWGKCLSLFEKRMIGRCWNLR